MSVDGRKGGASRLPWRRPAIDVQIAPVDDVMTSRSTTSAALLLFAFVIVAWGLNWTVTKLIVTQVTPLWSDSYSHRHRRLGVAHHARRQQAIQHSQTGRCPGHTRDFAVPHGRFLGADDGGPEVRPGRPLDRPRLHDTTLGRPGAWLLLKEDLSARQVVGIAIGLTGLAIMFNPRHLIGPIAKPFWAMASCSCRRWPGR